MASEALSQELTALRMAAEACNQVKKNGGFPDIINNALILSFAVHFRNIHDFLYSTGEGRKPPQVDDIIAEDFFDNPKEYQSTIPQKAPDLLRDKQKLNKYFAHLTYARMDKSIEIRTWDFERIMNDLAPGICSFMAKVDPEKIDNGLQKELGHKTWKSRVRLQ